ncbi:hypothetical protein VIGAN_03045600, partial [Vigna angularis var. angularis]
RPLQAKPQNQQVSHFGSGSRPGLQARSGAVNKKGCAGIGVFPSSEHPNPKSPILIFTRRTPKQYVSSYLLNKTNSNLQLRLRRRTQLCPN